MLANNEAGHVQTDGTVTTTGGGRAMFFHSSVLGCVGQVPSHRLVWDWLAYE